jgi:hypothetical protein
MDTKFKEILDGLPDKPPRSRLEPYRELIRELRRRGRTYRDIARILAEKCQIDVTASGVHDFVRRRVRVKRKPAMRISSQTDKRPGTTTRASAPPNSTLRFSAVDEVQRKIATLKARKTVANPTPEKFRFDPSEPLRLERQKKKRE